MRAKPSFATNHLLSGIQTEQNVIRGEKANSLECLKISYYNRFAPTTPEQRTFVDIMIDAEFLLRRLRRVEAELWDYTTEITVPAVGSVHLGRAFHKHADVFARLQRRIDSIQRNYRNALQELSRLQAAEDAAASEKIAPKQPLTPEIGFVPQLAYEASPKQFSPPGPDAEIAPR